MVLEGVNHFLYNLAAIAIRDMPLKFVTRDRSPFLGIGIIWIGAKFRRFKGDKRVIAEIQ